MLTIVPCKEAKYGYLFVFFKREVYYVFSLESPHSGNSSEYTQYTIFNIKKKIFPICSFVIFPGDSRTSSKEPW